MRDLRPTADGGFVGCGFLFTRAPDVGSSDAWVFRMDSAGYLQAGGAPPTVVCTPVGLPAEVEATQTQVWPNPAPDGRYTVRAAGAAAYAVHDALGRRVAHGPMRGPETPLSLAAQPAGVYVLRLTWPDGRTVTKRLAR